MKENETVYPYNGGISNGHFKWLYDMWIISQ